MGILTKVPVRSRGVPDKDDRDEEEEEVSGERRASALIVLLSMLKHRLTS